MSTSAVQAQISELRWLVDQLEQEWDTLAATPYPRVHRFLMCNLTTRIARVAVQVQRHLTLPSPGTKEVSDEVPLVEQSA